MKTENDKKEACKNEFSGVRIKIVKKEELGRDDHHNTKRAVMIIFPKI